MALYCGPGHGDDLALGATSSRQSRTRRSASSHMNFGSRDMLMPARSWNSVWVNPGHSAVAVTPEPASSPAAPR